MILRPVSRTLALASLPLPFALLLDAGCSDSTSTDSIAPAFDAATTTFPTTDGSSVSFDGSASGSDASGSDATIESDAAVGPVTFASKSGTRLKLRNAKTAEGLTIPLGFRDTTLNQNCTVMLAGDGTYRCLPTLAASAIGITGITGLYVGATCVDPIARPSLTSADCTLKQTLLGTFSATETRFTVFPLGAAYTGQISIKSLSGACSDGKTTGSGYLIDLKNEVLPSTYVKMTSTPRTVAGVTGRMYIGDDGSEQLDSLTDPNHAGWDCSLTESGVFAGSCVPSRTGSRVFSNANCTTAGGVGRTSMQAIVASNECSDTTSIESLGASVSTGTGNYYTKNANTGGCDTANVSVISALYNSAGIVAANTLLSPGKSNEGSARLQRRHRTAPASTAELFADTFYDSTLGMPCTPQLDQSGQLRCLPIAPYVRDISTLATSRYGNNACTQEVVDGAFTSTPPVCATEASVKYWHFGSTDHSCSDATLRGYRFVKPVGAFGAGKPLYLKSGGVCVADTAMTSTATMWIVTSVDAATEFATLTEAQE